MKELTIEQKAQRYDEAIPQLKGLLDGINKEKSEIMEDDITNIFPELLESEDEKIRKAIILFFELQDDNTTYSFIPKKDILSWLEKQSTPQIRTGIEWVNTIDDACDKRYSEEYAHGEYCHEQSFKWGFQEGVDWLEKQGEQIPVNSEKTCKDEQKEWNEDDEKLFSRISGIIHNAAYQNFDLDVDGEEVGEYAKIMRWFKSLKERVQPQPKQEWSEEDEVGLSDALWCCNQAASIAKDENDMGNCWYAKRFLKSLKERYTWKPSYKQMDSIKH